MIPVSADISITRTEHVKVDINESTTDRPGVQQYEWNNMDSVTTNHKVLAPVRSRTGQEQNNSMVCRIRNKKIILDDEVENTGVCLESGDVLGKDNTNVGSTSADKETTECGTDPAICQHCHKMLEDNENNDSLQFHLAANCCTISGRNVAIDEDYGEGDSTIPTRSATAQKTKSTRIERGAETLFMPIETPVNSENIIDNNIWLVVTTTKEKSEKEIEVIDAKKDKDMSETETEVIDAKKDRGVPKFKTEVIDTKKVKDTPEGETEIIGTRKGEESKPPKKKRNTIRITKKNGKEKHAKREEKHVMEERLLAERTKNGDICVTNIRGCLHNCGMKNSAQMIRCDGCRKWAHSKCQGKTKFELEDDFICIACKKILKRNLTQDGEENPTDKHKQYEVSESDAKKKAEEQKGLRKEPLTEERRKIRNNVEDTIEGTNGVTQEDVGKEKEKEKGPRNPKNKNMQEPANYMKGVKTCNTSKDKIPVENEKVKTLDVLYKTSMVKTSSVVDMIGGNKSNERWGKMVEELKKTLGEKQETELNIILKEMKAADIETIDMIRQEEENKINKVRQKLLIAESKIKKKEDKIEQMKLYMKLKDAHFAETIKNISKEFAERILKHQETIVEKQQTIIAFENELRERYENEETEANGNVTPWARGKELKEKKNSAGADIGNETHNGEVEEAILGEPEKESNEKVAKGNNTAIEIRKEENAVNTNRNKEYLRERILSGKSYSPTNTNTNTNKKTEKNWENPEIESGQDEILTTTLYDRLSFMEGRKDERMEGSIREGEKDRQEEWKDEARQRERNHGYKKTKKREDKQTDEISRGKDVYEDDMEFRQQKKEKKKCYNCKENGHLARDCKERRRINNCTICKMTNHKTTDCWFKEDKRDIRTRERADENTDQKNEQLLTQLIEMVKKLV